MAKFNISRNDISQLVFEAVKRVIKESSGLEVYTMDRWHNDGSIKLTPGQLVDDKVIEELANSVPPTTYSRGIFQPGEAYSMSENWEELYMTFIHKDEGWSYIGLCPEGSTTPGKQRIYESYFDDEEGDIVDVLDCGTLSDILKKHGWSYSDAQDVRGRDGLYYVKYVVRKDSGRASELDVVIDELKKASMYPDGIKYSTGQYEFAPEIKIANIYVAQMESDGEEQDLFEGYETVQWQHFDNDKEEREMFEDAVEAIEMSDGEIDFDEWYPAFQDVIEPDDAEIIWQRALKHCGYSGMLN